MQHLLVICLRSTYAKKLSLSNSAKWRLQAVTCNPGEHGFQVLHAFSALGMSHRSGVVRHDDCRGEARGFREDLFRNTGEKYGYAPAFTRTGQEAYQSYASIDG